METENFIRDQVKKILSESSGNFTTVKEREYSNHASNNSANIVSFLGVNPPSSTASDLDSSKKIIDSSLRNEHFNRVFDGAFTKGPYLFVNVKKNYTDSGYKVYQAARYIGAIITACVEQDYIEANSGFEIAYDTDRRQVRLKFN